MNQYEEILEIEKAYLNQVVEFLEEQIQIGDGSIQEQKKNIVELRKEMWSEGARNTDEFDRAIELNQYMTMEAIETSQYAHKLENLRKYEKMVDKPYFGRFDFTEEDDDKEEIYVGYHNIMNDETYEVLVYDWRAPIASIFYRSEIGKASYSAPCGQIDGAVHLKRQYEIKKRELEYFFDCSLTITDEILQQALGKNASSKMKNIVETIQKEQDQIIRNKENDLLIVQGVAGSGKTSIAMHRVAYLLYDRIGDGLTHNNIMIISPNNLFGEYISNVLPELGEENVSHITIEEIFEKYFGTRPLIRSRNSQLEYIINNKQRDKVRKNIEFKGSNEFITLLDRLVDHFEHKMLKFEDIYYNGQIIENKQLLKSQFLNNKINMPIAKRLNRIEQMITDKLKPYQKKKRQMIEAFLIQRGGHEFEETRASKLILGRQKQATLNILKSFTKVDILNLYRTLFKDNQLFNRLAEGLDLQQGMEDIMRNTLRGLNGDRVPYEDGVALLYLKLKIEGNNLYPNIKQVVIDEAQDYYPVHYKVFGEIFKGAQYTVLGDVCQTIEKKESESLYDEVIRLLNPKNAIKLSLTKSYRSSYQINEFNQKLRGDNTPLEAVERYEEKPLLKKEKNSIELQKQIINQVEQYKKDGFETITILCKTKAQVKEVHSELSEKIEIRIVTEQDTVLEKGVLIMPIYMAKGLEYDAVIIYEANSRDYHNDFDKQLLYIAGTRALHRLSIYYTGEISPFLIGN
ncbi:MAG: AAA family ATPase [Cellulosilyticaceae bacterium]